MIMISFISQILSLFKSSVVAGSFGAGNEMDAYNLANNVVVFIFSFIASGISTIIIPEYANKRNRRAVDTFITAIYGILLIFSVIIILLRNVLFGVFANNRGEAFASLAADIFVISLLSHYLSSIANITVAYFQCEGKYNVPKIASLICQILIIISLLFLEFDIVKYTLIICAGTILNFLIDTCLALKSGWRYKPALLFDNRFKQLLKRFLPIIVSTGVYQLTLLIDTTISSFLATGNLSILSYSTMISSMVHAVLIGNLTIYMYPKITKRINEKGFQAHFWDSTVAVHSIVCLISAGFLTVGHEAITLLLQRGAFTEQAAFMVFIGTSIYIVGNQTNIIREFIYRYFYASGETKTPGINSVFISILNIVFSIILVKLIGFFGIILGTVLVSVISLGNIMFSFRKKIGFCCGTITVIGKFFKSFVIFLVTVALVCLTKHFLPITNEFVSMIVYGIETLGIYIVITFLFNKRVLIGLKDL